MRQFLKKKGKKKQRNFLRESSLFSCHIYFQNLS